MLKIQFQLLLLYSLFTNCILFKQSELDVDGDLSKLLTLLKINSLLSSENLYTLQVLQNGARYNGLFLINYEVDGVNYAFIPDSLGLVDISYPLSGNFNHRIIDMNTKQDVSSFTMKLNGDNSYEITTPTNNFTVERVSFNRVNKSEGRLVNTFDTSFYPIKYENGRYFYSYSYTLPEQTTVFGFPIKLALLYTSDGENFESFTLPGFESTFNFVTPILGQYFTISEIKTNGNNIELLIRKSFLPSAAGNNFYYASFDITKPKETFQSKEIFPFSVNGQIDMRIKSGGRGMKYFNGNWFFVNIDSGGVVTGLYRTSDTFVSYTLVASAAVANSITNLNSAFEYNSELFIPIVSNPPTQYHKIRNDLSIYSDGYGAISGFSANTINPGSSSFLTSFISNAPNTTLRINRLGGSIPAAPIDFNPGNNFDITHTSAINTTRNYFIYRDGSSAIVSFKQSANSPFVEPFSYESKDDGLTWSSFPSPKRYKGYYARGDEASLMDKGCLYSAQRIVCLTNMEYILDNLNPSSITSSPILFKSKYENGSWTDWTTAKLRIK
ncbi:MAG: hypothetical protein MH321_10345 [Leptospiraceae bacterium]|nr:hypothetical protein [Leptospiraceae bacterium]